MVKRYMAVWNVFQTKETIAISTLSCILRLMLPQIVPSCFEARLNFFTWLLTSIYLTHLAHVHTCSYTLFYHYCMYFCICMQFHAELKHDLIIAVVSVVLLHGTQLCLILLARSLKVNLCKLSLPKTFWWDDMDTIHRGSVRLCPYVCVWMCAAFVM